jgi:hypothetical protein
MPWCSSSSCGARSTRLIETSQSPRCGAWSG